MQGKVKSINISTKKGVRKEPVKIAMLVKGNGIQGDVHASPGDRQVSFLAGERIEEQGLKPGDFAENITTKGFDLSAVKIGDRINIGNTELKVSKIGKECHTRCQIYVQLGDCIMPREGVFAEVAKGGEIRVGNIIEFPLPPFEKVGL